MGMVDSQDQPITRREFELRYNAHTREHDQHTKYHEAEHKMTEIALNKADANLEKRLEGMNGFRAQLERQASEFVTREIFDSYVKEQSGRNEIASKSASEKYDAIMNAIVNRHDSDMDSIKESIQAEREHRKTFEGSMNTWKWIASFLGASGVAGVILLFITRFAG